MKIGIYGGTFNPVHNEHINIVKHVLNEFKLDKIIIVSTNITANKTYIHYTNAYHRINMLKLAFKDIKNVEISLFEVTNYGISYTYITANYYKQLYKNDDLFFIFGSDSFLTIKQWEKYRNIIDNTTTIIIKRNCDQQIINDYISTIKNETNKFLISDYNSLDISSTKIRLCASLKIDIQKYTLQSICRYIQNNKLYYDFYSDFMIANVDQKRRMHIIEVVMYALSNINLTKLKYEEVFLAALLHDCAKNLDLTKYKSIINNKNIDACAKHAYVGEYIAQNVFHINNKRVLNAIKYHTTAKNNMSLLGKLIFVADKIEPSRDYDGVCELRQIYYTNLDLCFKKCLRLITDRSVNKNCDLYVKKLRKVCEFYKV